MQVIRKKKKDGDIMPTIIEEIVRIEHSESDAFIRLQQKRLVQLREIEEKKQQGKRIQKIRIVRELQNSGILDESGNLSEIYFNQDQD